MVYATILSLNLLMIFATLQDNMDLVFNLEEIGQIDTPGMARDVVVKGDAAFVAAMSITSSINGGLFIFNISDPSRPQLLGHFFDEGSSHRLLVEDDIVFVADNFGGLEVFNVSNLTNPVKIIEVSGTINGFYKKERFLYAADYSEGLLIFDITNLTKPMEITRYTDFDHALMHLIRNNLAYVSDDSGLKILDISNLSNITELVSYSYDYYVYDLQFAGEIAYTACARSIFEAGEGIKIWNASDPLNFALMGSFFDGGMAFDLQILNNYALVADFNDGVEIIDVSNPYNPIKVTNYYDGGNATQLYVVDDLIYVADGFDGLEIIRMIPSDEWTTSSIGTPSFGLFLAVVGMLGLLQLKRRFD
ncbi:MAG: LVIVD repeat-containing protein [Candidatus Heimdallarchaeota archaeon]